MPPPSIPGTGLAGILAETGSQKVLNRQGRPGKGILGCSKIGTSNIEISNIGTLPPGKELELKFGLREGFIFNWHLAKGRICKSRVGEGVENRPGLITER